MPTYNSLQMHKFKSFPVPLNVRALHLPVLSTKKMVNSDNKVQLHHIKLRRCAHNVRTCYAGNAGGILHLRHEMKASGTCSLNTDSRQVMKSFNTVLG